MKIEYQPGETKTYQTTESFKVSCERSNVAMWVLGDAVRFLGYNGVTDRWDEWGFRQENLTTELLLKFVEAYNKRNEK